MNLLLSFIVYVTLVCSTSAVIKSPIRIETKTGFLEIIPKNESTTTKISLDAIKNIDEKDIKSLLLKMISMATSSSQHNKTETSDNVTTEKDKASSLGVKTDIRNKPEKYAGNGAIGRLCPYFIPNGYFHIDELAAVLWPRFYNMKEKLKCFKIDVEKQTEQQLKENEATYGTFGGIVDWRHCHFEIKPTKSDSKRKHFLMGDVSEKGVMRNMIITKDANGDYRLQEEAPDQWLLTKRLVVLRDCITGDVVVFTKSPQHTTSTDIVEVLQDLGEEMTGQMVCDEDDNWLKDDNI